jgi:hypothetical protein
VVHLVLFVIREVSKSLQCKMKHLEFCPNCLQLLVDKATVSCSCKCRSPGESRSIVVPDQSLTSVLAFNSSKASNVQTVVKLDAEAGESARRTTTKEVNTDANDTLASCPGHMYL